MLLSLAAEIERAASDGLLQVALFAALSVPDIGAALESPNGRTNGTAYSAWFDKYVAPSYAAYGHQYLTGADCWQCRCSILHQGQTTPKGGQYRDYLFVTSEDSLAPPGAFKIESGTKLVLSVRLFCSNMIQALYEWLDAVGDTALFEKNSADSVRMLQLSFKS